MLRLRLTIGIIIGVFALVLAGLFAISASSWFLWFALPATSSIRWTFSNVKPVADFIPASIQSSLPFPQSHAYRLGSSQSDEDTTLVVLPRLTHQKSVVDDLNRSGWQTRRMGLLVCASRRSLDCTSYAASILPALKTMVFSRLPVFPDAILSINGSAREAPALINHNSVAVIASASGQQFKILSSSSLSSLNNSPRLSAQAPAADISLSVPGSSIALLPEALRRVWNDSIQARLHLANTKPDIMDYLSQFEWVRISLSGEEITLAIDGAANSFDNTVEEWLTTDDRYSRPAKKVFRLPDGTLGREQVPGASRNVLTEHQDNCRFSIDPYNIILCRNDGAASLSNRHVTAARQALMSPDIADKWQIDLNQSLITRNISGHCTDDWLGSFWCRVSQVTISGQGETAFLHATIK